MNRKAIAIALIALMAISAIGMMPAKVKAGIADNMQGGNLNVYGNPHLLYYDDSDLDGKSSTGEQYYRGNITGLDANNGAITHSYNQTGEVNDGDYYSDDNYWCEYMWDATSAKYGWSPSPPSSGDTIVVVSEIPANGLGDKSGRNPQNAMGSGNGINYTYATIWTNADTSNVADDQYAWYGRYEPIPNYNATTTKVGDTWINMSIPLPKYTDWNDTGGKVEHRGTFDAFKSYAVFMESPDDSNYASGTGPYDGMYFMGNAYNISLGPDAPLPAYEQHAPSDPNNTDTGYAWINITGLQLNSAYYFKIRTNFDFGSYSGGYHGGMGSGVYTTYGSSLLFKVRFPEFSTLLIPVVITISLFVAVSYIRRK